MTPKAIDSREPNWTNWREAWQNGRSPWWWTTQLLFMIEKSGKTIVISEKVRQIVSRLALARKIVSRQVEIIIHLSNMAGWNSIIFLWPYDLAYETHKWYWFICTMVMEVENDKYPQTFFSFFGYSNIQKFALQVHFYQASTFWYQIDLRGKLVPNHVLVHVRIFKHKWKSWFKIIISKSVCNFSIVYSSIL